MAAIDTMVRGRREAFVAELTEVALATAAQHGVGGSSVDLELRLWKRLEQTIGELSSRSGWEHRLAVLTSAVYEVVLEQGFAGAFLDLEMGLWAKLRWVVRSNRFVARQREDRLSAVLALR